MALEQRRACEGRAEHDGHEPAVEEHLGQDGARVRAGRNPLERMHQPVHEGAGRCQPGDRHGVAPLNVERAAVLDLLAARVADPHLCRNHRRGLQPRAGCRKLC